MTSYPQQPETWKKYQARNCDTCWAGCCTLPVEAKIGDIIRLGLAEPHEKDWPLENVAERLQKKKIIQAYIPKSQIFILAQVAGRDCIFLDANRRCSVYEKRPDTCRNFPQVGPRSGYCPASAK